MSNNNIGYLKMYYEGIKEKTEQIKKLETQRDRTEDAIRELYSQREVDRNFMNSYLEKFLQELKTEAV